MNQDTYYGNEYNYNLKPFQKLEYVKKTPPPNNKFDSSPDIIEEIKSLPASTLSTEKALSNELNENEISNEKKIYENCAMPFICKMCPSDQIPLPKLMLHLNLLQY